MGFVTPGTSSQEVVGSLVGLTSAPGPLWLRDHSSEKHPTHLGVSRIRIPSPGDLVRSALTTVLAQRLHSLWKLDDQIKHTTDTAIRKSAAQYAMASELLCNNNNNYYYYYYYNHHHRCIIIIIISSSRSITIINDMIPFSSGWQMRPLHKGQKEVPERFPML